MDSQSYFDEPFVTEEEEQPKPPKGKSIAALILGIASLVLHFIPLCLPGISWLVSLVTCIVAKCLIKNAPESGLKKGAKITSTISLILHIIGIVLTVLGTIAVVIIALIGMGA